MNTLFIPSLSAILNLSSPEIPWQTGQSLPQLREETAPQSSVVEPPSLSEEVSPRRYVAEAAPAPIRPSGPVCLSAPASKGGRSCAEEHVRRRLVLVEEGGREQSGSSAPCRAANSMVSHHCVEGPGTNGASWRRAWTWCIRRKPVPHLDSTSLEDWFKE